MPVRSQGHFKPPGAHDRDPASLQLVGAFTPVEVHVPTALAANLSAAGQPIPPPITGLALIDTGATFTGLDNQVAQSLRLNPINVVKLGTADGVVQANAYTARLEFPTLGIDADPWQTVGVDLGGQTIQTDANRPPQDVIALVGRDYLQHCLLIWNGPNGSWTIAY